MPEIQKVMQHCVIKHTINKTYDYFRILKISVMKVSVCLSALILIGLLSSCGGETELVDNDLTISGLNSQVETITRRTYQARKTNDGWGKGPVSQTYSIIKFDNGGFKINENTYFVNNNQLYSGIKYDYDSENNLVRINRLGGDGSQVGYTEIVKRIGKVRPSKFNNYFVSPDETTKTGSSIMTWEDYLVKESTFFDKDGAQISSSSTSYNKDRHITEFSTFKTGDKTTMILKYTYLDYDKNGNWTLALKEFIGFNFQEMVERIIEYYPEVN